MRLNWTGMDPAGMLGKAAVPSGTWNVTEIVQNQNSLPSKPFLVDAASKLLVGEAGHPNSGDRYVSVWRILLPDTVEVFNRFYLPARIVSDGAGGLLNPDTHKDPFIEHWGLDEWNFGWSVSYGGILWYTPDWAFANVLANGIEENGWYVLKDGSDGKSSQRLGFKLLNDTTLQVLMMSEDQNCVRKVQLTFSKS